jgi:hypothetical protein
VPALVTDFAPETGPAPDILPGDFEAQADKAAIRTAAEAWAVTRRTVSLLEYAVVLCI